MIQRNIPFLFFNISKMITRFDTNLRVVAYLPAFMWQVFHVIISTLIIYLKHVYIPKLDRRKVSQLLRKKTRKYLDNETIWWNGMLKTRLPCQHKNSGISGCHIKTLRGNSERKRWVGGEDIHLPICQLLTITLSVSLNLCMLNSDQDHCLVSSLAGQACNLNTRRNTNPPHPTAAWYTKLKVPDRFQIQTD